MRNTAKKAFTIAELTIVLALIAIVSAMVVSFSAMTDRRVKSSQANLELIGELDATRTTMHSWLDAVKKYDADLSLKIVDGNPDKTTLVATVGADEYFVKMGEKALLFEMPNSIGVRTEFELDLTRTFEIYFDIPQDTNGQIIFVTAICNMGKKQVSYTFTVRSHVGETV